MNLNIIKPKNKTQELLLSITRKCETLIEQYDRKTETLEFKTTKAKEIFHFKPPFRIQGDWMIGLTSLEVYKSVFNITEGNNKFELYAGPLYTELSYTTLKDKVAEVLGLSDLSPEDFEKIENERDIIEIYRKLSIEKSLTVG